MQNDTDLLSRAAELATHWQGIAGTDADQRVHRLIDSDAFLAFCQALVQTDPFSEAVTERFSRHASLDALAACRRLHTILAMPVQRAMSDVSQLLRAVDTVAADDLARACDTLLDIPLSRQRVAEVLAAGPHAQTVTPWLEQLTQTTPHAVLPTSSYRDGAGHVLSAGDDTQVEAVMQMRTTTSVRVTEGVLDPDNSTLRDVYRPLGRCVALVDETVFQHYGDALQAYFDAHRIRYQPLVYRAMEVDKGIATVERMMGDFKRLGVGRHEPVLIAGGGVLSDTGGLACALYHRSTPYVMLSTSIVTGVDAGPSPRTCCDGFGYKNLFGAYHAPILAITDRSFFATLETGWLRHGVAEIVKMAVVKDAALFALLETHGADLVRTRFGTVPQSGQAAADDGIVDASRRVIAAAMRSYVEAEYGNLYETHQARPHAYGHTWSPGFEIAAGLLHGHAVGIGMGFGAFLAHRIGWIDEPTRDRILGLITSLELSLWHPVINDHDLLWQAQQKMTQKRGGLLAAPLPKGGIGQCGYLPRLERTALNAALDAYTAHCAAWPRHGVGIEPHCRDVGLEDPSTVGSEASEADEPAPTIAVHAA